MAVEKAMGLRKGERMKKIYPIEVVSVRTERLADIKQDDIALEGFPEMTPFEFVEMFCALHKGKGCTPETPINRIEFRPIEPDDKKTVFLPLS